MRLRWWLLLAPALAGCGPQGDGPVPIRIGMACEKCGMEIRTLKFACETVSGGRARIFDSLECMASAGPGSGRAYVADYDTGRLIDVDSAFVVRGHFPSPMGGGLAAFAHEPPARDVALQTRGEVSPGARWRATWADSKGAGL